MHLKSIQSGLIVSCQAPINSPLHNPKIIASIAQACVNQGAKAVRIDTPSHVKAVKEIMPEIPVIGLWKQQNLGSSVYITPRFQDAVAISEAGAEIIALDCTQRLRPGQNRVPEIIDKIHRQLGKLVMADIDTMENAIFAAESGADIIGTTLYGYTEETQHLSPPGYDLLSSLVEKLTIPIICEGGIATPEMAQKALQLGAYAVVVGAAITGIDILASKFQAVFPS
jgi:N-acylglucosamine-6-phosphate 2-epimerase